MSEWVSFEEIKSRVSIEDVLDHYGVKLRRRRDELTGRCPFPQHEDQRASFSSNTAKNVFQCFGCKKSGNVLDFVAFMESVDVREAALMIAGWFQVRSERPSGGPKKLEQAQSITVPPVDQNKPLTFELQGLDPTHPYLAERVSEDAITYFGLGYCSRGVMKGRIAIPVHDEHGQLVAYAGRWPGETPEGEEKYRMPVGFHKAQVVFNLHRATTLARESKGLIVTEGFFDCFTLWQGGFPNAVSLMGSSLSQRQKELLIDCVGPQGKLTLLFDSDEAGKTCLAECIEQLTPHVFVKAVILPEDVGQPDELTEQQTHQLLYS